jgi:hypothetical protein
MVHSEHMLVIVNNGSWFRLPFLHLYPFTGIVMEQTESSCLVLITFTIRLSFQRAPSPPHCPYLSPRVFIFVRFFYFWRLTSVLPHSSRFQWCGPLSPKEPHSIQSFNKSCQCRDYARGGMIVLWPNPEQFLTVMFSRGGNYLNSSSSGYRNLVTFYSIF